MVMREPDVRRMAAIGWRTIDQYARGRSPERPRRDPLSAPRRTERRGIPAWSSRSLAERRPLRRLHCRPSRP
jgi:hypothetical protein